MYAVDLQAEYMINLKRI